MKTSGRMHEAVVLSKKRKDTLWKPPSFRHLICTMVRAWHWITSTWSLYCLGSFVLHVWEWEQVKRNAPLGRHMTWILFNDLLSLCWYSLWFHNADSHFHLWTESHTWWVSAAICDFFTNNICHWIKKISSQAHISFFSLLKFWGCKLCVGDSHL
jgi:hypothetical protein